MYSADQEKKCFYVLDNFVFWGDGQSVEWGGLISRSTLPSLSLLSSKDQNRSMLAPGAYENNIILRCESHPWSLPEIKSGNSRDALRAQNGKSACGKYHVCVEKNLCEVLRMKGENGFCRLDAICTFWMLPPLRLYIMRGVRRKWRSSHHFCCIIFRYLVFFWICILFISKSFLFFIYFNLVKAR